MKVLKQHRPAVKIIAKILHRFFYTPVKGSLARTDFGVV